ADVVQTACIAGVLTPHRIRAVTHLEPRRGRRLMIDANEEVVARIAGREIASTDRRSAVAHAVEHGVDRRHDGWRNRHDSGPALLRALEVGEPERPALRDR